jgi:hypothetical protein
LAEHDIVVYPPQNQGVYDNPVLAEDQTQRRPMVFLRLLPRAAGGRLVRPDHEARRLLEDVDGQAS